MLFQQFKPQRSLARNHSLVVKGVHEQVAVDSAKLRADGRTVFLEIPGLKPVMQLQVQYNLNAKEGASLRGKVYATINRIPSKDSDGKSQVR